MCVCVCCLTNAFRDSKSDMETELDADANSGKGNMGRFLTCGCLDGWVGIYIGHAHNAETG